jgi:hypothetical protein
MLSSALDHGWMVTWKNIFFSHFPLGALEEQHLHPYSQYRKMLNTTPPKWALYNSVVGFNQQIFRLKYKSKIKFCCFKPSTSDNNYLTSLRWWVQIPWEASQTWMKWFYEKPCKTRNDNIRPQPQWTNNPPAHHPLDACYYSVVDEPQLS